MTNRRKFIQTAAASIAAGMLIPRKLFASKTLSTIGIQLYTIRELVQKDFIGTLRLISQIGYNAVEAAGYANRKFYGLLPREYALICNENGLQPLSTHTGILSGNADEIIEDTVKAGMQYLVLPSIPSERRKTIDDYQKLADDFNVIGSKCKEAGIKFGYHNHAFEFNELENQVPYDLLLTKTDPGLCFMQLDLYWMVYAGFEPKEYFKRFPDRFELWHVKDMKQDESRESTEIGSGVIDFPELFRLKDKAGMKYFFVEQEAFKIPPEESIAVSFRYLEKLVAADRR